MNTVQSRMMGQAIAERMYTSYIQANNQQLAQVVSRNIGASQAMEKSRDIQPAKGLQPTMSLAKVDLRSKALSFEQSGFLRDYRNHMLDMQSMAADLVSGQAEVRQTLAAGSDAPGVAEVSGRLANVNDRYSLRVDQVATGQVSRSAPLDADDPFPTASGSLRVETNRDSVELFMSGAGYENNRAMLESFAEQINRKDTGVTASVEVTETRSADAAPQGSHRAGESAGTGSRENGGVREAVLRLESNTGGEKGSFKVEGTLADKLKIARDQEAPIRKAVYSIAKNGGKAESFTSDTNSVAVDKGISALLKGTGTANVASITDAAESMAERLANMVGKYNDALSFLNGNAKRGVGVQNQLDRMLALPRSGDMLERIGITRVRDGVLNLDRSAFIDQSRRAPSTTNQIVEDFAEDLRTGARDGMKESSGSLVGPLEYVARAESKQLDPVNVLSTYSRNGVYNLMNLYAAGVLMNLNA